METLAYVHLANSCEDQGLELEPRSLKDLGIEIPSSAWMGLASLAVAVSILSIAPDAQAVVDYGNRGSAVSAVQQALRNRGYNIGSVDGVFGSQTETAVVYFQRDNGLTADGVVGPATAAALGLADPSDPNSPYAVGQGGSSGGNPDVGVEGYVTITAGSGLYVRSGPGTGYSVVGGLPYGSVVYTYGYSNGWYRVSGGWIAADYTSSGGSGNSGGGGGSPDGYVTVDTSIGLYVRSGPGTGYSVVGGLSNGETVYTYEYSNGWYRIASGWISAAYVY
jgi:peptidoglycan hydrolase-like protein with peptidoglycan-binding domain